MADTATLPATAAAAPAAPVANAPAAPAPVAAAAPTAPAEASAPVVYDLKPIDGSNLDAAHLDGLKAFAAEHKVAPEFAQKLLERDHGQRAAWEKSQVDAHSAVRAQWKTELLSDTAITPQTVEDAKALVIAHDPDGSVRKFLNESGLGDNPVVAKFLGAIGARSREGSVVPATGPSPGQGSVDQRWFAKSIEQGFGKQKSG